MVLEYSLIESIQYTLFEVVLLAGVFYVNLEILIPRLFTKPNKVLYCVVLFAVMGVSFFTYFLASLDTLLLGDTFDRALTSFLLNHSLFVFISFMLWYFQNYSREQLKNLRLEKDKLHLEISLLKSQISPHFLFNTLNNIYSLAVVKDDNTPKMLATTSNILRYYVNNGHRKLVPLKAEIEILEQYIYTQEMRKLQGEVKTDFPELGDLDRLQVPPFVLLTLLENAFKHGDISINKRAYVSIHFSISDSTVNCEISNSYQKKTSNTGIGLQNIRSQLDLILGTNYNFELTDENSIFSIKLQFNGN
ncbi:MAG: hypothetical protein COA99_12495 [Moraxellaceae bacterium]|nr:MAG: hypothetical protein COA99_12495 [Moraxellaceae bacterium]